MSLTARKKNNRCHPQYCEYAIQQRKSTELTALKYRPPQNRAWEHGEQGHRVNTVKDARDYRPLGAGGERFAPVWHQQLLCREETASRCFRCTRRLCPCCLHCCLCVGIREIRPSRAKSSRGAVMQNEVPSREHVDQVCSQEAVRETSSTCSRNGDGGHPHQGSGPDEV